MFVDTQNKKQKTNEKNENWKQMCVTIVYFWNNRTTNKTQPLIWDCTTDINQSNNIRQTYYLKVIWMNEWMNAEWVGAMCMFTYLIIQLENFFAFSYISNGFNWTFQLKQKTLPLHSRH